jgi:hypothetical protein
MEAPYCRVFKPSFYLLNLRRPANEGNINAPELVVEPKSRLNTGAACEDVALKFLAQKSVAVALRYSPWRIDVD